MNELNITFMKNHNNKLDNDVFTTIRGWTLEKARYYREQVGKEFNVLLQGKGYGRAKLKGFSVKKLRDIDLITLRLDTGLFNTMDIFGLFHRLGFKDLQDKAIILTFKRVPVKKVKP